MYLFRRLVDYNTSELKWNCRCVSVFVVCVRVTDRKGLVVSLGFSHALHFIIVMDFEKAIAIEGVGRPSPLVSL